MKNSCTCKFPSLSICFIGFKFLNRETNQLSPSTGIWEVKRLFLHFLQNFWKSKLCRPSSMNRILWSGTNWKGIEIFLHSPQLRRRRRLFTRKWNQVTIVNRKWKFWSRPVVYKRMICNLYRWGAWRVFINKMAPLLNPNDALFSGKRILHILKKKKKT